MSEINWGLPVILYLWLAGMAGGAYITAVGFNVLNGNKHRTLVRVATYITIPLFALGALILTLDLGRPERVWHMFVSFRPSSVMWFGTYFLLIGSAIGAGLALREFAHLRKVEFPWADTVEYWATRLGWLFALIVVAYIGVVFAQTAREMWSGTLLLPALFIASAISTGIAALALALHLVKTDEPAWVTAALKELAVLFIGIELVILVLFVAWLAVVGTSANVLLTGALSPLFWVGLVLVGLIVPLALELRAPSKAAARWVVLAAPALTLVGGLVLRYVITIGGQM
jgi:polysulfide reductase chain C